MGLTFAYTINKNKTVVYVIFPLFVIMTEEEFTAEFAMDVNMEE